MKALCINEKIRSLREFPQQKSYKIDMIISLCVLLLGAVMGFVAKATDSVSIVGDIGTGLSVWIFAATLIAVYSRYPYTAAVNVLLFFLAMMGAYYVYGQLVFGFFPGAYFMGWLGVAMLSPVAGFVVWFARGYGILGAVAAALPISVLYLEGYPAYYTHNPVTILTLCSGIALNILLPKTMFQKLAVFGMAVIFAAAMRWCDVLSWLPF